MTLRDYTANVISASKVVPDGNFKDSKASGVWDINEALDLIKGGNWPNAANINPSAFVDGLFSTDLYTGNGSTQQITNGLNLSGKGGLVWSKERSTNTYNNALVDNVSNKFLMSDNTSAAADASTEISSFNTDGFTLHGTGDYNNQNNKTYVSWTFRKQPRFFDIVTYTGNATAGRTISHNLGSVPGFIIVKRLNGSDNWTCYHRGVDSTAPEDYILYLNDTAARSDQDLWADTAPTSSVFSVGDNIKVNGSSSNTYVAYLFAHNADPTDSVQTSLQGKTLSNLGSAFDSSYPITEINDGVAETSNANSTGYVSNADMDISVDYGSAVIVNAYYIAPQGDQGGSVYNTPTAFTAYGSNDGSSWTSLASFSSISGFAAGSFKEFTFSNRTAYRYYRLEVTASSASGVSISEWEIGIGPNADELGNFGEAEDSSIIKCGSYTGNGSSTGPSINLGFEPQFVMIRNASSTQNWWVLDNMRGIVSGGTDIRLKWNATSSEDSTGDVISLTSTGFDVTTSSSSTNTNGDTYIYMAIRRGDMQAPSTPSDVFAISTFGQAGDSKAPAYRSTFPVDMHFETTTAGASWFISSRLTGNKYMKTDSNAVEVADSNLDHDYMNGVYTSTGTLSAYYGWMWRRAPGYFDVCTYTGTGVAGRTVNHNLGVVPEMMWVKRKSGVDNWMVYAGDATDYLRLNTTDQTSDGDFAWNDTAPTASVFSVGSHNLVNGSGETYIAYLFATVAGVSKVGSYTGDGTEDGSKVIDCGFSSGARFVLIKRTDSAGAWQFFDTARGLVAGNDPRLQLNDTTAQTTGYDFIDPDNSGFIVGVSTISKNAFNVSSANYIFYAIA